MKTILTIIACAFLALTVNAAEIIRGMTLTDGAQLYASDLHNLIDQSSIGVQFYNDQQTTPVMNAGYYFLVYDPATSTYRRITASTVLYGNTNYWLNQVSSSAAQSNASFLFYDPTNGYIRSITVSNLFEGNAKFIPVQNLIYANTNGYYLPKWPTDYGFTGPQTNQQPQSLWFDTNGIPYRQSLSNIESAISYDLGTNLSIPFVNQQVFNPFGLYGTNLIAPYTNAWGTTTNFAITNIYMFGVTNQLALSTNDSIPLTSVGQFTNTTVTVGAIMGLVKSMNLLPNYTQARVQFGGATSLYHITNSTFLAPLNELPLRGSEGNPFSTNQVTAFSMLQLASGTVGVTQNGQLGFDQIFYGVKSRSTTNRFLAFTNYYDAQNYIINVSTNAITYAGGSFGAGTNEIMVVTNFTSVNCDAVQTLTLGNNYAQQVGTYDIWFRTPVISTNYYVSGLAGYSEASSTTAGIINIGYNNNAPIITTNRVRIDINSSSSGGSGLANVKRAYVLISNE